MTIKSLTRSTIENNVFYRSMLAGNEAYSPGAEFLLEEVVLASSQASVTFDVSSYAGVYQHLQIRLTPRSDRASVADVVRLQFNGDTGSNYSQHQLYGNGSAVYSYAQTSLAYIEIERSAGGNTTSDVHSGMVIDLLDAFESNKNTTIRALSGMASNYNQITLSSGAWFNTAALTSINLSAIGNWVADSRFSLYGAI